MDEFKGNSKIAKNNSEKEKNEKNTSPITNQVKVKKESEFKKFTRQFISEDADAVKGHIFSNVIVPGIQRLLSDMIKNTVDGIIYGIRGIRPDQTGMKNIYNYNRISSPYYGGTTGIPQIPQNAYAKASIYSVNDVEFFDRGEAEQVLYSLREMIQRYGMVSVGDFYDLISQKHVYTDLKYGWRDLREAEVVRIRNGYQIKFPKIIPLE